MRGWGKKGWVLAIDVGTQSVKALVFDREGNTLAAARRAYGPTVSGRPGLAEQDPQVFWDAMGEAVREIGKTSGEVLAKVDTVSLTTQRDTCVLLDGEGKVLRPAISWADQRTVPRHKPVPWPYVLGTALTGMWPVVKTMSRHCHAHWIQEREPEVWKRTHRFLLLSGYFNFRMTGRFLDCPANQVGHIPFNYRKFRWESPWGLKAWVFQIPREKLCRLVEPGVPIGPLLPSVAGELGLPPGVLVHAAGSDKGCETLGVGCLEEGRAAVSLGTSATIQTTAGRYYETERFIPPFPAVVPGSYNPEVQVYRGYWMLSWFKGEFAREEVGEARRLGIAPEELLNRRLAEVGPGSGGLVLQPYWKPALKRPESKGTILGFSDHHTRFHLYRAILEGIGFALLEGMKKMERKSGVRIREIRLSGGGSQSGEICQITADIFGLPVVRIQTAEAAALGAAVAAYAAKGDFASYGEAVEAMVHVRDVFQPDPANARLYASLYRKVYRKVYGRVGPLCRALDAILPAMGPEGER
ncbi:FGGY-family carbohydrate kinase [Anaerotalea alkaliphila]|uniref:Carbohydrate kinase n=1 Tax=Anaerotalea alkaliphila TaxID=2662126 RepID=A0A7X5KMA5_9FIRM|nr:FGGY-family carbohydrate kinase [Anaerotalea alkaliphila]NDL67756.1 carbohydrate kinase [Anaerotalea alkaliphila]